MADAAPPVTDIADPAERAIAARGRYIVMTDRLHRLPRDERPAGTGPDEVSGRRRAEVPDAARHVRQPQPHAGQGDRPRAPDRRRGEARAAQRHVPRRPRRAGHRRCRGRSSRNWTEEDRHAVVVYLRHLKPVTHQIPEPVPGNAITIPGAVEQDYAAKDYGVNPK